MDNSCVGSKPDCMQRKSILYNLIMISRRHSYHINDLSAAFISYQSINRWSISRWSISLGGRKLAEFCFFCSLEILGYAAFCYKLCSTKYSPCLHSSFQLSTQFRLNASFDNSGIWSVRAFSYIRLSSCHNQFVDVIISTFHPIPTECILWQ